MVKWWRKAAEQNNAVAQYNLGICYIKGDGVPTDEIEAVKWIRKAAEQNNAMAQNILGLCYAIGSGIAKEYVEAYKWMLLSGMQGNKYTNEYVILIINMMSEEQILEGKQRASDWLKQHNPQGVVH